MSVDFHTTDINFGGGGDDRFLVCSTQRNSIEGQRSGHKAQAAAQLLRKTSLLPLWRPVRMTRMVLGVMLPQVFLPAN